MGSMPNYPCFGLLLFYVGPIFEIFCEGLVLDILCPKQKIIIQTDNKAKVCKDTNYCCFLPQTREAMIKTNPEIWDFNLQSIDDYYLRFGQISFLASAVNHHGALSPPKKNPKAQNHLWNIQRLKDPIQSFWNNRRHFAERDTIMSKALWIGISNFKISNFVFTRFFSQSWINSSGIK